jgi:small redox-active disulfide protein 1
MEILLELFTSPTCPYCPEAKRVVKSTAEAMKDALLIERDVSEPQNADLARRYGIYSVPALVVNGRYKIQGVPDPLRLMKLLEYL